MVNLIWIKNYGVPIKSNIKVFDDKIFLIDSDNKIISLILKMDLKYGRTSRYHLLLKAPKRFIFSYFKRWKFNSP